MHPTPAVSWSQHSVQGTKPDHVPVYGVLAVYFAGIDTAAQPLVVCAVQERRQSSGEAALVLYVWVSCTHRPVQNMYSGGGGGDGFGGGGGGGDGGGAVEGYITNQSGSATSVQFVL